MSSALIRYRIMAYVTGVVLLVLVLVAVPLQYAADQPTMVSIVGPVHGILFIVYLLAVIDLARRCRWTPVHTLVVMLAGTIPFMTFIVEHQVTREVRATASL
jgi:integral membrane protein